MYGDVHSNQTVQRYILVGEAVKRPWCIGTSVKINALVKLLWSVYGPCLVIAQFYFNVLFSFLAINRVPDFTNVLYLLRLISIHKFLIHPSQAPLHRLFRHFRFVQLHSWSSCYSRTFIYRVIRFCTIYEKFCSDSKNQCWFYFCF